MLSGEWEFGLAVVKLRALPLGRGVTTGAVLGESRSRVIRAGRFLIIRQMAAHAIGRSSRELVACVALDAGGCSVFSGESELGGCAVVEGRAGPLRSVVAGLTRGGETRGGVIGTRRLLEIRQVARHASSG